MTQVQVTDGPRKYLPYLDGVRGYGFLLVFLVHYFLPSQFTHEGSIAHRVFIGLEPIAFFAVPMFFVLSGYLIGGILFGTRNREGYFRVFYCRRVVRVFPVYYLALLAIGGAEFLLGFPPDRYFWSHFLFIQNLLPDYIKHQHTPAMLIQYWSLATEEQFYLLWPLVVWFFPDRRKLFGIGSFFIVLICGLRFAAPYFCSSPYQIRYCSLTRADAILLGVLLALICHKALFERVKPAAKWVSLIGIAAVVIRSFLKEETWPKTFLGEQILIPWLNFTAVAIIVAAMEENSWLNRMCSQRWICWLGKRSYGLYIIHFVYARWFWGYVAPQLSRHIPYRLAVLISIAISFSLTLVLAMLSYRFLEMPAQRLKQRLKYGPVNEDGSSKRFSEKVLVGTGA